MEEEGKKLKNVFMKLLKITCFNQEYFKNWRLLNCLLGGNRGYWSIMKVVSSRWQHQLKLVLTAAFGAFASYVNFQFCDYAKLILKPLIW